MTAAMTAKEVNEDVEFILIGAGLPRTGTMSTYTALEIILPGKCHHMKTVFDCNTGRNNKFWPKAMDEMVSDEDWKEFVAAEKLSSGVDYPISYFWKDLVRIYPNAKVLLNVRDPVRWYQSVKNTIYQMCSTMTTPPYSTTIWMMSKLAGKTYVADSMKSTTFRICTAPVGSKYPRGMFGVIEDGEETAAEFFNDWKAEVIKEVPADRLLVFEAKQGWGPLCSFLGVPEPTVPFPNVNDTAQQQKTLRVLKRTCYGIWATVAAGLASGVYYFM